MTCEAHYLLITPECRVVTRLTHARGGKVSRERYCKYCSAVGRCIDFYGVLLQHNLMQSIFMAPVTFYD